MASGPKRMAVAVVWCLTTCTQAWAQGNYQSSPLGGRSALMGGTGVSLGVDGAAPFLNPATIARIEDHRIAFSTKFFRYSLRTLGNWHQPGPVDESFFGPLELSDTTARDQSLNTLPDTTCYFFDVSSTGPAVNVAGHQRLALCLGKVQDEEFSINALNFHGRSAGASVVQSQSISTSWSRWSAGPSWGRYLTSNLSVGASVFLSRSSYRHSRTVSTIVDRTVGSDIASSYFASSYGQSWDVVAHAGATYKLSRVITLGASVRAPAIHLHDRYSGNFQSAMDNGTGALEGWTGEGSFELDEPTRLAVGIGAEWKRFRLEFDAFYYTSSDEYVRATVNRDNISYTSGLVTSRSPQTTSIVEESRPILNLGAGAEVFFNPQLSAVGGLATDFNAIDSLHASVSPDNRLFFSRLTYLQASAGIASYSSYGDLMIGTRFHYGWGQMAAVNAFTVPQQLVPLNVREINVLLILAGELSLTTVREAAKEVQEVVSGEGQTEVQTPPEPTPQPGVPVPPP